MLYILTIKNKSILKMQNKHKNHTLSNRVKWYFIIWFVPLGILSLLPLFGIQVSIIDQLFNNDFVIFFGVIGNFAHMYWAFSTS